MAILDVVEQSLGIITASLPALTAYIAKYVNMLHAFKVFLFLNCSELTGSQGLGVILILKRQNLNRGRLLSSSQRCLRM